MSQQAEQAVVDHALSRGYLTREQVREALLLREQLVAHDRPAGLLPLLRSHLQPDQLSGLGEVWRGVTGSAPTAASGGADEIPDELLRQSSEQLRRPPETDPESVRELLTADRVDILISFIKSMEVVNPSSIPSLIIASLTWGHLASISAGPSLIEPGKACHNASVKYGMMGWSNLEHVSSTWHNTTFGVCVSTSSSLYKRIFVISRYQSQNVPQ